LPFAKTSSSTSSYGLDNYKNKSNIHDSSSNYAHHDGNLFHERRHISHSNTMNNMQIDDNEVMQAIGTCEDMCPEEERIKRVRENDVHKLEIPDSLMIPGMKILMMIMLMMMMMTMMI
jgi:hypothetical protein